MVSLMPQRIWKKFVWWWEFEHPVSNMGIRTGQESGLVVLDIDPDKGGEASLCQLEAQYGPLPETATVLSGGGGRHLCFQHPGSRVLTTSGNLGPGLDTRGDGGYIVAPPSLHVSGQGYKWGPGKSPDKVPLAPLPAWLSDLLQRPEAQEESGPTERTSIAAQVILEGQRNTVLTSVAGGIWRYGVTEETLVHALLSENDQRCVPPLPEEEVKRIARSVARYPQGTVVTQEPYTELGNAKRFIRQHGQDLRFVQLWKKWLMWDGTRWAVDDTYKVIQRAKETVRSLPTELASIQEDEKRRAFLQHIARSEGYRWIANIVELAKSEPGVPVSSDQLDADPWVLKHLQRHARPAHRPLETACAGRPPDEAGTGCL
jgi:putative DNA primase/helicase